jgi:hypothetical protein
MQRMHHAPAFGTVVELDSRRLVIEFLRDLVMIPLIKGGEFIGVALGLSLPHLLAGVATGHILRAAARPARRIALAYRPDEALPLIGNVMPAQQCVQRVFLQHFASPFH